MKRVLGYPSTTIQAGWIMGARIAILLAMLGQIAIAQNPPVPQQWRPIERAFGTSGKMLPGGVFELDLARKDVQETVDGITLNPSLDETDMRFMRVGRSAMVMGEIALLTTEVNPVIARLRQSGLTVSAVHSHIFGMTPQIIFVHFSGRGTADALATRLRNAIAASKTPLNQGKSSSTPGAINSREIERIFGQKGDWNNGVFEVSIPRREQIRHMGVALPPEMGVATELAFQPLGNGAAVATGEFVLLASEVDPVIDSLQRSGFRVTAVHNHFLTEQPRIFYLHFLARGNAVSMATQLRAALMHTNSRLVRTTNRGR